MTDLQLFDEEITDKYARENFVRIRRLVQSEALLKGRFVFFEVTLKADKATLAAATTPGSYPVDLSFAHGLNFKPTDVIQLAVTPDTVTTTWKFDSFTRQRIFVTVSGPCTLRAFIGRYEEN